MSDRRAGWIRKLFNGQRGGYAFIAVEQKHPEKDYYWPIPDGIDRSELRYRTIVTFIPVLVLEPGRRDMAANVEIVK